MVGLLTVFSMTKIWAEAFWKPHPAGETPALALIEPGQRLVLLLPVAALAALTVTIGLFPEPFVAFAERRRRQLLEPSDYLAPSWEPRRERLLPSTPS